VLLFGLRAEAARAPSYWLDLEIRAEARLHVLDSFLRDAWLECCEHLSAFAIGGVRYEVEPTAIWDLPTDPFGGPRSRSMNASLEGAFLPVANSPRMGVCGYAGLRMAGTRSGSANRRAARSPRN
jgi:hypothetical protein